MRIEYAPEGLFENRPSFRAMSRPEAIPFASTKRHNSSISLHSPQLDIKLTDADSPPEGDNLKIVHRGGQWTPDSVDDANLGGCHCSLDCINDKLIPRGVHPATSSLHDNGCHWSLWNYTWRRKGATSGEIDSENR